MEVSILHFCRWSPKPKSHYSSLCEAFSYYIHVFCGVLYNLNYIILNWSLSFRRGLGLFMLIHFYEIFRRHFLLVLGTELIRVEVLTNRICLGHIYRWLMIAGLFVLFLHCDCFFGIFCLAYLHWLFLFWNTTDGGCFLWAFVTNFISSPNSLPQHPYRLHSLPQTNPQNHQHQQQYQNSHHPS